MPFVRDPFLFTLGEIVVIVDPLSDLCHYIKQPQVRRESLGYDAGLRVLSLPLSITLSWVAGAFLEMSFPFID